MRRVPRVFPFLTDGSFHSVGAPSFAEKRFCFLLSERRVGSYDLRIVPKGSRRFVSKIREELNVQREPPSHPPFAAKLKNQRPVSSRRMRHPRYRSSDKGWNSAANRKEDHPPKTSACGLMNMGRMNLRQLIRIARYRRLTPEKLGTHGLVVFYIAHAGAHRDGARRTGPSRLA